MLKMHDMMLSLASLPYWAMFTKQEKNVLKKRRQMNDTAMTAMKNSGEHKLEYMLRETVCSVYLNIILILCHPV